MSHSSQSSSSLLVSGQVLVAVLGILGEAWVGRCSVWSAVSGGCDGLTGWESQAPRWCFSSLRLAVVRSGLASHFRGMPVLIAF